jgi:hypothetical protein
MKIMIQWSFQANSPAVLVLLPLLLLQHRTTRVMVVVAAVIIRLWSLALDDAIIYQPKRVEGAWVRFWQPFHSTGKKHPEDPKCRDPEKAVEDPLGEEPRINSLTTAARISNFLRDRSPRELGRRCTHVVSRLFRSI